METVLIYLGIILSFLVINTIISAICWTAVLNMGYWWQLPNMELIMFTPIVNVIVTFIFVVMYTIKCIKERIEKKVFETYFYKYKKHEDN